MKDTLRSKTIWFNILTIFVGMATLYTPLINAWVTSESTKLKIIQTLLFLTGAVNLILRRFFTTKPLG